MMTSISFFTLMSGIAIILIGYRILLLDWKNKLYRAFFALCIVMGWMTICWYEMSQATAIEEVKYYRQLQSVWVISNTLILYNFWIFANRAGLYIPGWLSFTYWLIVLFPIPYLMYLEIYTPHGHGAVVALPKGGWGLALEGLDRYAIIRLIWTLALYIPTALLAYVVAKREKNKSLKRWKWGLFLLVSIGMSSTFFQNYILPLNGVVLPLNEGLISFAMVAFFGWSFSSRRLLEVNPELAYEGIAHSMTNLLVVVNRNFEVKEMNPAAITFFKKEKSKVSGLPLKSLLGDDNVKELVVITMDSGRIEKKDLEVVVAEESYHLLLTMGEVYNRIGISNGYYILGTNLTPYRRAIEQVSRYAKALEKSNEALEQFAYITSHDLKEPLRSISGFSALIYKRINQSLDAETHEYFDYIKNGVNRMDALIESILQVSRYGGENKNKGAIHLKQLIESVTQALQLYIEQRNAIIECKADVILEVDHQQMEVVFQNLIENGVRYNRQKKPRITIDVKKNDKGITISVKDNGIGIAKPYHKKVFTMFTRLHNWSEFDGTGIGLSICKRVVEDTGGNIWIDSEEGKGTTFYIFLPQRVEILQ